MTGIARPSARRAAQQMAGRQAGAGPGGGPSEDEIGTRSLHSTVHTPHHICTMKNYRMFRRMSALVRPR